MVNWETLDLMCQVSDLSDDIIAFELKSASNVELLLDFILEVSVVCSSVLSMLKVSFSFGRYSSSVAVTQHIQPSKTRAERLEF